MGKAVRLIHGSDATERLYQFDKMEEAVKRQKLMQKEVNLLTSAIIRTETAMRRFIKGKPLTIRVIGGARALRDIPALAIRKISFI